MTLDQIQAALPAFAKDLKLNLGSIRQDETLSTQRRWGTMLACALASRNATLIRAVAQEADTALSPEAAQAARAAAAIMGMNNIYYRFVHLASEQAYATMPARLRMQVIGNPGVDKADFEFWSLAVSAINGCGMCIDSHEKVLRQAGVSQEEVQAAVRIASVLHAIAAVLDGEAAESASRADATAAAA
jgi:alkyl hydroperoxide reductase subunit D